MFSAGNILFYKITCRNSVPKNLASRVNTYAISILAVEQLLRYSTECTQQKKKMLLLHSCKITWECMVLGYAFKFSLENKLLSLPMKSY